MLGTYSVQIKMETKNIMSGASCKVCFKRQIMNLTKSCVQEGCCQIETVKQQLVSKFKAQIRNRNRMMLTQDGQITTHHLQRSCFESLDIYDGSGAEAQIQTVG